MSYLEDALITLNAAPDLSRAVICRLGKEPQRWLDEGLTDEVGRNLALPAEPLRRARAALRQATRTADRERSLTERHGGRILVAPSAPDRYPAALLDLPLPPPVLYLRGELPDGPAVAMVGSRRANPYGERAAETFARSLAEAGVTIVSGFARGIDTTAHRGALAAAGGRTVAVLGCGLGLDYPAGQRPLAADIAAAGAVLSEFPCNRPPRRWNFPVRNRVIAALARATLVVQAARKSGSLITAHHALELGRDVFAVPGSIFDPLAAGPNSLLADGATPALEPRDLLEPLSWRGARGPNLELGLDPAPTAGREPPEGLAGLLLQQLPEGTSKTPDELTQETGADPDRVLTELLELELAGWLKRLPGPAYCRGGG